MPLPQHVCDASLARTFLRDAVERRHDAWNWKLLITHSAFACQRLQGAVQHSMLLRGGESRSSGAYASAPSTEINGDNNFQRMHMCSISDPFTGGYVDRSPISHRGVLGARHSDSCADSAYDHGRDRCTVRCAGCRQAGPGGVRLCMQRRNCQAATVPEWPVPSAAAACDSAPDSSDTAAGEIPFPDILILVCMHSESHCEACVRTRPSVSPI